MPKPPKTCFHGLIASRLEFKLIKRQSWHQSELMEIATSEDT